MKIAIILGTRPEIIKMAPVIRAACLKPGVQSVVWHTGQHYSFEMDAQIFKDLELPEPDANIHVGSASHARQTGNIMIKLEELMLKEQPDAVLVQGDTNTVLGGALAAVKLHIPLGHVEAGLRSHDRSMPEEINRVACDHVADVLYAPTKKSEDILLSEGISRDKVVVTGNTIVDAVQQGIELAKSKTRDGKPNPYILFTMHRAENVDNTQKLSNVVKALERILDLNSGLDIIWPVHPRTKKQLESFGLADKVARLERVITVPPPGFLDTLMLQANARLVMTDSGGIQEEACVLGVPCITLRHNTERPESVDVGANELVGTSTERIVEAVKRQLNKNKPAMWQNPFGDGQAGAMIIDDLISRYSKKA